MFDPIDYVIFEGLSEKQKVDNIIFVDIKSGGARLTQKQKKIKQVVKDKKVVFKTYKPWKVNWSNSLPFKDRYLVCAPAVVRSSDWAMPMST